MRKLALMAAGGFALALAVSSTAMAEGGCGAGHADKAETASAPYTPAPTAAETQTGADSQG